MVKKQIEKSEQAAVKSRREIFATKKDEANSGNAGEKVAQNSRADSANDARRVATPQQMSEIQFSLFSAAVFATIRLTLPVMILFSLGLFADKMLNQPAIFAVLGAILGFFVGGFLVYEQIQKLNKRASTKNSENHPEKVQKNPGKTAKKHAENGGEK